MILDPSTRSMKPEPRWIIIFVHGQPLSWQTYQFTHPLSSPSVGLWASWVFLKTGNHPVIIQSWHSKKLKLEVAQLSYLALWPVGSPSSVTHQHRWDDSTYNCCDTVLGQRAPLPTWKWWWMDQRYALEMQTSTWLWTNSYHMVLIGYVPW